MRLRRNWSKCSHERLRREGMGTWILRKAIKKMGVDLVKEYCTPMNLVLVIWRMVPTEHQ
jgi:hypothetical protein